MKPEHTEEERLDKLRKLEFQDFVEEKVKHLRVKEKHLFDDQEYKMINIMNIVVDQNQDYFSEDEQKELFEELGEIPKAHKRKKNQRSNRDEEPVHIAG